MTKKRCRLNGILRFLLILPVMDIPPRPPGKTKNFRRTFLKRETYSAERPATEILLIQRQKPDETPTGSEDELNKQQERQEE